VRGRLADHRDAHRGDRTAKVPGRVPPRPNLAGPVRADGGAGTALVGSHTEVADRIEEYARLGISEFILSGYPHLEEAYWFGEGVLPIPAARGVWRHPVPEAAEGTAHVTPFAPTAGPAPAAAAPAAAS